MQHAADAGGRRLPIEGACARPRRDESSRDLHCTSRLLHRHHHTVGARLRLSSSGD
ncbi:uncharacterized protein B0I36DRAFT_310322 [Microdochium trichocladiopsis]|uniref:Uncharacterized protein n=1 Tax=Microdochium trichocladiopsis TaxID=1682393 RepID=A0A9P8YHT9_9PEZI|nr:uncharacterized protein B0I36DRAFT_310322 [Microdochium trichocladiopsis]KAH7040268.1 hypothetical protein B0I36DRAFT_310322 [Microdochium trichocladiopsis]